MCLRGVKTALDQACGGAGSVPGSLAHTLAVHKNVGTPIACAATLHVWVKTLNV
jgi:hypothetical protein